MSIGASRVGVMGASGGSAVGWIIEMYGSGNNYWYDVDVDSVGNIYTVGTTNSATTHSGYDQGVVKYNTEGVIQWSKNFGHNAYDELKAGRSIAIDSSDNIFIWGNSYDYGRLSKVNTSGTLVSNATISDTSRSGDDITNGGISTDGTSIYISGKSASWGGGGGGDGFLAKYNSSTAGQWARAMHAGSLSDTLFDIAVDSSNVYVVGTAYNFVHGGYGFSVANYNSSGTKQWSKMILPSNGTTNPGAPRCAVDGSGNVYVARHWNNSPPFGGTDILLVKINSSGTLQWQRGIGSSSSESLAALNVDGSDNVYMIFNTQGYGVIAKYNSSGTLQYQVKLSHSNNLLQISSIAFSTEGGTDYMYIVGYFTNTSGVQDAFLMKVPTDGSGLGSFGDYTYATASMSTNTPTVCSLSTASFTSATLTMSTSVSGNALVTELGWYWSSNTLSLTSSLIEI
jgi:hypothetical protein